MEALQKLLQQTLFSTGKPTSTTKVAQKGNFSHALNISKGKRKSWIVDSRASDHMTGDITVFDNYSPCHDHSTVQITDGTLSKVVGKGSVVISEDITLNSVLYVPKLDCNLLSISKLSNDLNCVTKFSPNVCVFQILGSGKTIGSAEECDGLYLLQVKDSNKKPKANSCDWQSLFQHPSHSPSDHLPNQQNRHFNSLESVWLFSFCSQPRPAS